MAKTNEKNQAVQLRKTGISIKQIAQRLGVSPSTVSLWCRDISLSKQATEKLIQSSNTRATAGLLAYSETKRHNRQKKTGENHKIGQELIGNPSKRDLLCIGLGLYWCEGYKNGNREFGFTNSDPHMILFYLRWLLEIFSISKEDLILRISINAQHETRLSDVEKYWSQLTNIPNTQFTKTSLVKTSSKKKYTNLSDHYGTLRIKVRRGSDFREQILGAIAQL